VSGGRAPGERRSAEVPAAAAGGVMMRVQRAFGEGLMSGARARVAAGRHGLSPK
jgi:hypothetical protein